VRQRVGAAEVVAERQMDDALGVRGPVAQRGQVAEVAAHGLGARGSHCLGRTIRPRECDHVVAGPDEFGDHGRSDQTGSSGDEDLHAMLLEVMGLLSHHRSTVMGPKSHQ
jgi:hypothetical protein